jgi:hypothetical protein
MLMILSAGWFWFVLGLCLALVVARGLPRSPQRR